MSKFDSSMKAIGRRLRQLFGGRRVPLTWHIIDKLENLADAEENEAVDETAQKVQASKQPERGDSSIKKPGSGHKLGL